VTIGAIKALLEANDVDSAAVDELRKDPRIGVQKLVARYDNKVKREYEELQKYITMSVFENELRYKGINLIAGVDEVGRGPLAGPVIAAAVILPADCWLFGIDDSKKLSESRRQYFYEEIQKHALAIGVGVCSSQEIDEHNIYQATKLAMERAVLGLQVEAQHLLLDAMELPQIDIPQQSIIKGDARSVSIAAASIIAKVTRDAYMSELAKSHPEYGFERHVGYGTKDHLEALELHGIIQDHRRSFEPIKSKYGT